MKHLYRPDDGQQIAGVAAGLALYFNVDVTLVRLAFVLGTVLGGPGFMIYIVLWFVMPEESDVAYQDAMKRKNEDMI